MSSTTGGPLPLTTTFTPPSQCVSDFWVAYNTGSSIYLNLGPTTPSLCLPTGWDSTTYFSPGVCPSGYGIAASVTVPMGNAIETVATCCPVSAVCQWTPGPNIATTFDQTYWTTISTTPSPTTVTTTDSGTLSGTNGLINAYGVVIRWQSTDFSNAPATAVATTTGAAAEATHDSSGLTAGADVGIGIGAAVAVILFVAMGVFLLRRRNRREGGLGDATQRDPYMVLPEHPSRMQVEAELPISSTKRNSWKALKFQRHESTTHVQPLSVVVQYYDNSAYLLSFVAQNGYLHARGYICGYIPCGDASAQTCISNVSTGEFSAIQCYDSTSVLIQQIIPATVAASETVTMSYVTPDVIVQTMTIVGGAKRVNGYLIRSLMNPMNQQQIPPRRNFQVMQFQ
ncbi:hypothetical protein PENARI_c016G05884 [Penicillium arizonense]|uniref:Mid2 domain-containing protein n=1 Tax=Penicillium arizonense TaxID=1835702 RepID=A0A1F5LCI2_PENAI|nr:hypothetical protein PENARI_c016G05884 [Penicillium arizonense]OGE50651.1 hypothetical protein PENARI_c016G05884 [Penicillium arizonense]